LIYLFVSVTSSSFSSLLAIGCKRSSHFLSSRRSVELIKTSEWRNEKFNIADGESLCSSECRQRNMRYGTRCNVSRFAQRLQIKSHVSPIWKNSKGFNEVWGISDRQRTVYETAYFTSFSSFARKSLHELQVESFRIGNMC
jgi:hypothetical protein